MGNKVLCGEPCRQWVGTLETRVKSPYRDKLRKELWKFTPSQGWRRSCSGKTPPSCVPEATSPRGTRPRPSDHTLLPEGATVTLCRSTCPAQRRAHSRCSIVTSKDHEDPQGFWKILSQRRRYTSLLTWRSQDERDVSRISMRELVHECFTAASLVLQSALCIRHFHILRFGPGTKPRRIPRSDCTKDSPTDEWIKCGLCVQGKTLQAHRGRKR